MERFIGRRPSINELLNHGTERPILDFKEISPEVLSPTWRNRVNAEAAEGKLVYPQPNATTASTTPKERTKDQ